MQQKNPAKSGTHWNPAAKVKARPSGGLAGGVETLVDIGQNANAEAAFDQGL